MPGILFPRSNDLLNAIRQSDLNAVQTILAIRNPLGVPVVGLNDSYGNASTALMWALWQHPINLQIVQVLLDCRDNQGFPSVNVNAVGPHGQTIYSFIVNSRFEPNLRRQLLQSVIDQRGPQGELMVDLRADNCNIPLLRQAVKVNDLHCLRILLDARLSDGSKALNVNEVRHGKTVLDIAMERNNPFYTYDQAIVDAIVAAGGRSSLQPIPNRQPFPREIIQPPRRIMNVGVVNAPVAPTRPQATEAPKRAVNLQAEMTRFNNDKQNTHDPSVTHTMKGSINTLDQLYGQRITDEKQALNSMRQLLTAFDYNTLTVEKELTVDRKRQCAFHFLELLEKRANFEHSRSGFQFSRIYALVWQAVIDDCLDVYPEDIRRTIDPNLVKAPANLITMKKASLVEKFIEADRTYAGAQYTICDGGSIHKLLEALHHAHTAVIICTGSFEVMPVATQVPALSLRKMLQVLPIRQQRKIISGWETIEGDTFKKSAVSVIDEDLQRQFGELLTKTQRDEITGQFDYFPCPIMHEGLCALINNINELVEEDPPWKKARIAKLKNLAKHAYDESDRGFQEEYIALKTEFEFFQSLEQLIEKINALPESRHSWGARLRTKLNNVINKELQNCNTLEKEYNVLMAEFKSFQSLEQLIEKINGLPESKHSWGTQLRTKLNNVINKELENCNTLENEYNVLMAEFNSFQALENQINTIADFNADENFVLFKNVNLMLENLTSIKEHYSDLTFYFAMTNKVINLLQALRQMEVYGRQLQQEGAADKSKVVIELVTTLRCKKSTFFNQDKTNMQTKFLSFRNEVLTTLAKEKPALEKWRLNWKTIIKNVLIAMTGIGFLLLVGKLAYSAIYEERPLFFFQAKQTNCEKYATNIECLINSDLIPRYSA